MSDLDPVITRQFGWAANVTETDMMLHPDLRDRFKASYTVDPSYALPDVLSREVIIDGPRGPQSLRIRIYTNPRQDSAASAFVWVHGGGFISGHIDDTESDGVARELVARASGLVITVDYALANGTTITYPTLHREVAAATQWVLDNARELNIDPTRLTLGGASAGANLALAATLEARDTGQPLPARLALIYPFLHRNFIQHAANDTRLDDLPSLLRISPSLSDYMFSTYVGDQATDATYASADEIDLSGLPPTLVVLSEYDDLRASSERYIKASRDAGGTVTSYLAEGTIHGHLSLTPNTAETARTLDIIAAFLRS